MYSTSSPSARGDAAVSDQFTVITPKSAYRVKARSEVQIRTACTQVGIDVLGVERDSE